MGLRAGLIFLAGLLVGGAGVAWLVAESPTPARESPETAPLASTRAVAAPAPRAISKVDAPDEQLEAVSIPKPEAVPRIPESPSLAPETPVATPARIEPGVGDGVLLPALRLPVDGVTAGQLSDTFSDARGTGRVHDAIDIMAPEGTPVRAVAAGKVVKLFDSVPGGTTLYQFDTQDRVAFYYAHLQRYADGIKEGQVLAQGDLIGYVGHTGNASPSAPHLHFAITVLGPDKRWWEGEAINPYPLLSASKGEH